MDHVQLQVEELAVIQSAYPEITLQDHGLVDLIDKVVAGEVDPEAARLELQQKPCVSLQIFLHKDALHMRLEFPKNYPETSLKVSLRGSRSGLTRSQEGELVRSLLRVASNAAIIGEGCGFEIIQIAETYAIESVPVVTVEMPMPLPVKPVRVCRRLIYSHHIIATDKRAAITSNALELRLGGFVKHGWPGVILVEGLEGNVEEYYRRLKRFQWKHLEVRGEEIIEKAHSYFAGDESHTALSAIRETLLVSLCRIPRAFEELGDCGDALSEAGRRCREAGLEDLFSTLFSKKLSASSAAEDAEEGVIEQYKAAKREANAEVRCNPEPEEAGESKKVTLTLLSYGRRHGKPPNLDLTFNCTKIENPSTSARKGRTGLDKRLRKEVMKGSAAQEITVRTF